MTVGFFAPAKMVSLIDISFAGAVRESVKIIRLFVRRSNDGRNAMSAGKIVEQKRDRPITIWVTESDEVRISAVMERLRLQSDLMMKTPFKSTISYFLLLTGLGVVEKRKSK